LSGFVRPPSHSCNLFNDGSGRRGLLNLGQTCFLNSVLQAFLHTPLIRAYFLSDKHNRLVCKTKDCTCCELDELFSEAFSGAGTPFAPTGFLTTMWRASAELAGYSQQDAHEAFVSVRHGLHASARGSTQSSCNCIVHDAFGGMLQSNVRCAKCATVTQTLDPIMDVPLEVRGEDTLAACLRKYVDSRRRRARLTYSIRLTSPEELVGKDYACSKCKSSGVRAQFSSSSSTGNS
jgi:ubiquitin carboxyl-terminal hydrolase 22/27/51